MKNYPKKHVQMPHTSRRVVRLPVVQSMEPMPPRSTRTLGWYAWKNQARRQKKGMRDRVLHTLRRTVRLPVVQSMEHVLHTLRRAVRLPVVQSMEPVPPSFHTYARLVRMEKSGTKAKTTTLAVQLAHTAQRHAPIRTCCDAMGGRVLLWPRAKKQPKISDLHTHPRSLVVTVTRCTKVHTHQLASLMCIQ